MENITQNIIVLSANQYSVTDEKTGELNEGTTVRYITTEDFSPTENMKALVKGHRPAKATLPLDDYNKIPTAPGLYEASFTTAVDSKGKASLLPTVFKFISDVAVSKANSGNRINLTKKEE